MKIFKLIKQHDSKDCGVACIAMILDFYDSTVPISKLRLLSGTGTHGTSAFGLVTALESFGFVNEVFETDNSFWEESKLPFPFIAHVIIDESFMHYVVVYGRKKDKLLIADPSRGKRAVRAEAFNKEWTGILIMTHPAENYVPVKDSTKGLFSFVPLLINQKKTIIEIIILSFLLTIFGIIGSYYFQVIIDQIIPRQAVGLLEIISVGLLSMYILQAVFQFVKQYLLTLLGQRLGSFIMLQYFNHVLHLPMNFFSTRKSGEIISRFLDANKIIDALANATLSLFLDVTMVVFVGTALFLQNQLLFLISLATIPVYASIVFLFMKPFDNSNEEQMESSAVVNSQIIESLRGIETIKSFNATDQVYQKVENQFTDLMKKSFRNANLDNLQSNMKSALQVISATLLLWAGTALVLKGRLSIGQLITYNALMSFFTTPLQNIINLQVKLQTAKVANERLNEVFALNQELLDDAEYDLSVRESTTEPTVTLSKVTFGYGFEEAVLKNVSCEIEKNSKVAIVGMSGSGKSTLAKLLLNFYELQLGKIEIQGKKIQTIPKSQLREAISYVSQETFFFSGSIYENLTFGLNEVLNDEKIIWACELAQIKAYIESQPLNYQFQIEEGGSNLSGGQKQRLAIARALLKNSEIMILDEATSGLDTRSEHEIIQSLLKLKDKTIIFIAHHLSIAKACDQVLVLENGHLVESGTHDRLRSLDGVYKNLWEMMASA